MASKTAKFEQPSLNSYYPVPVGDLHFVDSRLGVTSQGDKCHTLLLLRTADMAQTESRCRTTRFSRLAVTRTQSQYIRALVDATTDSKSSFTIDDRAGNTVSRNHCEVYVIVYEEAINHVYVRDRKSINGTYVNGKLVGCGPEISSGYLLTDGDVIEIRPYWKFRFSHHSKPMGSALTDVQIEEAKIFKSKYRLTSRCLGKGADASIYLAIDTATRKQLVCKVVDLKKLQLEERAGRARRTRLMQETDILRQLQHPNILPYVDAISSPHTLYTFTELASGGDLMSFLFRHPEVKEFDARLIIRQIVHGLAYLHKKGIVHRDLKPENVLLAYSPRVPYHRIMLADFGASAVPRRSRMVTMIGTPDYQAPTHTAAADIWSLGVIAYMLVSGDEGRPETLGKHNQGTLADFLERSLSKRDLSPSDNAKSFIKGCLQVSCGERMTITEAGRHDWLCIPRKHLHFFRKFDQRMMADWQSETQLKPLPLELQSLKDALARSGFSEEIVKDIVGSGVTASPPLEQAGQRSDYFLKPDLPQKRTKPPKLSSKTTSVFQQPVGVYEAFGKPDSHEKSEDEIDLVNVPQWTSSSPSPPSMATPKPRSIIAEQPEAPRKAATQADARIVSSLAKEQHTQPSSSIFPWMGMKPRLSYKGKRRTSSERKQERKAYRLRHSHFAIPISSLDRRLPPTPGGPERELVLNEVQKTKKPFLKNSEVSSQGLSPPSTGRARVEPNTKRRRTSSKE